MPSHLGLVRQACLPVASVAAVMNRLPFPLPPFGSSPELRLSGRIFLLVDGMVPPGLSFVHFQHDVPVSFGQNGWTISDSNPVSAFEDRIAVEINGPVHFEVWIVVIDVLLVVTASRCVRRRSRWSRNDNRLASDGTRDDEKDCWYYVFHVFPSGILTLRLCRQN